MSATETQTRRRWTIFGLMIAVALAGVSLAGVSQVWRRIEQERAVARLAANRAARLRSLADYLRKKIKVMESAVQEHDKSEQRAREIEVVQLRAEAERLRRELETIRKTEAKVEPDR